MYTFVYIIINTIKNFVLHCSEALRYAKVRLELINKILNLISQPIYPFIYNKKTVFEIKRHLNRLICQTFKNVRLGLKKVSDKLIG